MTILEAVENALELFREMDMGEGRVVYDYLALVASKLRGKYSVVGASEL